MKHTITLFALAMISAASLASPAQAMKACSVSCENPNGNVCTPAYIKQYVCPNTGCSSLSVTRSDGTSFTVQCTKTATPIPNPFKIFGL